MDQSRPPLDTDVALVAALAVVPSILRVVCQTTGMGFSAVARVTETSWTACAVEDNIGFGLTSGGTLAIETTLCREVRGARAPIVIEHASEDPVFCTHHTPRIYGLESFISVPIVLSSGEYFGNLCALDKRPLRIGAPQFVEMFRLFAELIARQLEDERRHLETGRALADERNTADLREQFIAVLGHDLRSPLGAVAVIGEVLQREPPREKLTDLGRRLLASSRRMSSLIDDVLDFARGRMGSGIALNLTTEHHLDVLMSNVVAELQLSHEARLVRTAIDIDRPIVCDPTRVQQLLSNLVKNALVHSTDGSKVSVDARILDNHLGIQVRNEGKPIRHDDLHRIFEPFWRSAGNGRQGQGLGLGLYICSQIAKAHGGSLEVESSQETGTRFRARLPLVALSAAGSS